MRGQVTVRLAGLPAVHLDGTAVALGSKARRLLVLLALRRPEVVTADRMAEALWDDGRFPRRPADNVASLVSRLRRALGRQVIDGSRHGYRLGSPPAVRVDLDEAIDLVREAGHRLTDQPAQAAAGAARALELLGAGGLLVGEPEAVWVASARAEGDRLLREARHLLAQASLSTGELAVAQRSAELAIDADRFDEVAHRLLMTAHRAAGEQQRALAVYERLRTDLATELGVDPAPQTRQTHLAVLRERDHAPEPPPARTVPEPAGPAGRDAELRQLARAWSQACAGEPTVLLLAGEGGIGRTRLAAEVAATAEATGGLVLRSRCYAGERSLAMQPFVDALAGPLAALPAERLRDLAGSRAAALAGLMPQLEGALGRPGADRGGPELELRRAHEAVTQILRGLAADRPALLVLDDLHNTGMATVELLHYVARHVTGSRLLVVATVRTEEGSAALDVLAQVTTRLDLGPLDAAAVARLAAEAGHGDRAADIAQRTRGHTLFVVETLRGLDAGDPAPSASLQSVVLGRLRRRPGDRGGPAGRRGAGCSGGPGHGGCPARRPAPAGGAVLRAGHLRPTARPGRAQLRVRQRPGAGGAVRHPTPTPTPIRSAYHARAADLLGDTPEAVATHAAACEDWPRAARAFLCAADAALGRFATTDAEELAGRAVDAAERGAEPAALARAHLTRGRARQARARFAGAVADQRSALDAARRAGERDLELAALRDLGGQASLAGDHASIAECTGWLHEGLRIAEASGDRRMQASLLAWLGVVSSNRLRFADAVSYSERAVAAGRAADDEDALVVGLDGMKNAHAYLGEHGPLRRVLGELEPLLRRRGDPELLQWTVFESAFPAIGAGDWADAVARIEESVRINRRAGPTGHDAGFVAHLGWLARLQGRYDEALAHGRDAMAITQRSLHRWFGPAVAAQLATTLLELGRRHDPVRLITGETARLAEREGAEANRLRCAAVLAEASGSPAVLAEADALLAGITAPPGSAWLLGTDCYLAVARAWLAGDQPGRARAVLAPLLAAAERQGWTPAQVAGAVVEGRAAAAVGDDATARAALRRAVELGDRHGMPEAARHGRRSGTEGGRA